jgi:hypothetical protein
VVAALIDLRSATDRARFDALAAELGARIAVTALGTGWIELGRDVLGRAATLIQELPQPDSGSPAGSPAPAGRVSVIELTAADIAPVRSDRFGNAAAPAAQDIATIAGRVAGHLAAHECRGPLVVVGCEENMFLPLAVAHALDGLHPDGQVRFSTTTRSPIVPLGREDYAIAGALSFISHDVTHDGPGVRFAYNLSGTAERPGTLVVFPEPGTAREVLQVNSASHSAPLAQLPPLGAALAAAADDVVVVLLPADYPGPPQKPSPSPSASTPSEVAS